MWQAARLPPIGLAYLNPPNPLFKGAHQASVRTRARGHRFAVLRPASEDALLTLRTVLFRLLLHVPFRGALSDWPLCFGVVLNTAVTSLLIFRTTCI